MGFLGRLDDRVIGPKGQPPDPRRMRAGHWFGVAITLSIVVAGFIASGTHNPAIWPLAGMAAGSLLFGGRAVASQRSSEAGAPDAKAAQHLRDAHERDIHDFASTIVEDEQRPNG